MSERFNLKWTDFQSVVSQSFSVLRGEEDFYDVTLVSDDQTQLPAHKLVLSASSHFFKSILKRNPHSHPLLYLSGVDSKNLGFVLNYIYQGEVQIYQHDLDNFLEIAQKLKIEGILSTEDPELKAEVSDLSPGESSYLAPRYEHEREKFQNSLVRNFNFDKTVSVSDMSEAEEKIELLIEKIDKLHHCKSCDYSSGTRSHVKEHVERHIEGLSYSCQFCSKTHRSRNS